MHFVLKRIIRVKVYLWSQKQEINARLPAVQTMNECLLIIGLFINKHTDIQ